MKIVAGYIMTIGSEEYLELFYAVTASGKPRKRPPNKASSKGEGQQMAKEYFKCLLWTWIW